MKRKELKLALTKILEEMEKTTDPKEALGLARKIKSLTAEKVAEDKREPANAGR